MSLKAAGSSEGRAVRTVSWGSSGSVEGCGGEWDSDDDAILVGEGGGERVLSRG